MGQIQPKFIYFDFLTFFPKFIYLFILFSLFCFVFLHFIYFSLFELYFFFNFFFFYHYFTFLGGLQLIAANQNEHISKYQRIVVRFVKMYYRNLLPIITYLLVLQMNMEQKRFITDQNKHCFKLKHWLRNKYVIQSSA